MSVSPKSLWEQCLCLISENVSEQQYNTWFKPLVFKSYQPATKCLLLLVPSMFVYEYLEEHFIDLLKKVLTRVFGERVMLTYSVITDKDHHLTQELQTEGVEQIDSKRTTDRGNQSPTIIDSVLPDIDSQLDPHKSFNNYVEGDSNKMPLTIGLAIAEHPNKNQFNPLFVYGPSGCGKTHLINAIGLKIKKLYPQKRVLYVSARLFQVQYTNSVRTNTTNDFIHFYQTIDILLVDDIQEWMTATKTQDTFFHIFNHLSRNGKRIILASDRPPVDLRGMNDRLLTRFKAGLITELEKPNIQLCIDILHNKIKRDGLIIPEDVIQFIAQTANGSVRDLQGVINSLLAYSVVYNSAVDMNLAERVIKRAVKIDNEPLTIDDILEKVCDHFNVTQAAVNSRSRKKDIVIARQVTMYMAQKYTKMPACRIGKLVGGRDHSTVIHSCTKIEDRLQIDKSFTAELAAIENSFKLK
ncbi:chromosomal replication initiator protein DnaA [Prevotella amnii]|jgi:chromosomal replication initiator protein dnaA|uniref:Chromosomal replication initiator protein DnaA n=1 Tax=Prevotella amnii DNF00058 TaxID=1401066 RepID=A0A096AWF5_9BACT|nr:chromosomal replication initiator protein DnaA [Prevotella amnii]KGF51066.1 chromosomal replication initiation protein [Prevotella amnii DNF00058]